MIDIIYRRPLTSTYFTGDGEIFSYGFDDTCIIQYQYSATTFDEYGYIEIWKLRLKQEKE